MVIHLGGCLKYQLASGLSIKRVIAGNTNFSLLSGNRWQTFEIRPNKFSQPSVSSTVQRGGSAAKRFSPFIEKMVENRKNSENVWRENMQFGYAIFDVETNKFLGSGGLNQPTA